MKTLLLAFTFSLFSICSSATEINKQIQQTHSILDFQFDGETLNGILSLPTGGNTKGIVLIVHGYGKTDAVAGDWYADVRSTINRAGYATYMWDKIGAGSSTGDFDINQPVEHSADEVIAAISMLRSQPIRGVNNIGLWGISRAGWINPLVIDKHKDIAFWISVSGVDGLENFGYLLEQNLIIEGNAPQEANAITQEWLSGTQIAHRGGSYSDYKNATKTLAKNPFWLRFTNGGIGMFGYLNYKTDYMAARIDKQTGLQIYIEDFEAMLTKIEIPVLAIFGEKDMNVDWRKTQKLYERAFSDNTLVVETFANCNHNIFKANTGGYFEFEDDNLPWDRCDGFLETIYDWLIKLDTADTNHQRAKSLCSRY